MKIDLVAACGDLLGLAIEESLGQRGEFYLLGQSVPALRFPTLRPRLLDDYRSLKRFDALACVQAADQFRFLKVSNVDGKLYAVQGDELVALSDAQAAAAKAFLDRAGIAIKKGSSASVPLELSSFLGNAERLAAPGAGIIIIDELDPLPLERLTTLQHSEESFSHWLAGVGAGRLSVLNCHPLLGSAPHPSRDSGLWDLIRKNDFGGRVVPWLDVQAAFTPAQQALAEPFVTRFHDVFSDWSDYFKEMRDEAAKIQSQLTDRDKVARLYSLLSLFYDVTPDFTQKAWFKTAEILRAPKKPAFAVLSLSKP
jgi:hypothetical protein